MTDRSQSRTPDMAGQHPYVQRHASPQPAYFRSSPSPAPSHSPLLPESSLASTRSRSPQPPLRIPTNHNRVNSGASMHSILPAAHPMAQFNFGMRESRLNGGPGPEFDDLPERQRHQRESRFSRRSKKGQYSPSLYSDADSMLDALPQLPQGDVRLTRKSSSAKTMKSPTLGRLPQVESAHMPDNPFMDSLREEELPDMLIDDRSSYRTSAASSAQYDLYMPDRPSHSGDGAARGIDDIIQELQDIDENDREDSAEEEEEAINYGVMQQASLGRRATGATVRSIGSNKQDESVPAIPELDGRVISRIGQTSPSSLAASTALPSVNPLSPRSPYGASRDLHAAEASRALGSRESPHARSPGSSSSRARSPLVPLQPYHHGGENTPPKKGSGGAGASGGKIFLMPQRNKSIKDRVGNKAPAELDMDVLKDAEAHGSITSLPGLIGRAMNMAQNLEHGKTSSKQTDWFGNEILRDLAQRGRSTASLGQVLDGFNFSSTASQKEYADSDDRNTFDGTSSEFSRRSLAEKFNHQRALNGSRADRAFPLDDEGKPYSKYDHRVGKPFKPSRKCCGIPLWLFIVLMVSAVVLVALAVALPVVLVKHKDDGAPADSCATKMPCKNRGLAILGPDNACQCMCVDSFSGHDCGTSNPSGCGTVQTSTVSNATVGQSLVDLFNRAQAQYNIALNASAILPVFNQNNLTCDMQNALITVTGNSKRSPAIAEFDGATQTFDALSAGITASAKRGHARDLNRRDANAQTAATTVNGIVVAGGDGSASSGTSTASAAAPTSSSGPFKATDPTVVTFAQTAILYLAQVSNNLGVAIGAQAQLQRFFGDTSSKDPQAVDLGNGFTANLQVMNIKGNNRNVGKGI